MFPFCQLPPTLSCDVHFLRKSTNKYPQNKVTVRYNRTILLKKAKLCGIRKEISKFPRSFFYVMDAGPIGLGHWVLSKQKCSHGRRRRGEGPSFSNGNEKGGGMAKDSSSKYLCFPILCDWNCLYILYGKLKSKNEISLSFPLPTLPWRKRTWLVSYFCVTRETLEVPLYNKVHRNRAGVAAGVSNPKAAVLLCRCVWHTRRLEVL